MLSPLQSSHRRRRPWLLLRLQHNGASPSLRAHYGPSSLLRLAPPLYPALVLWRSWGFHLRLSLSIGVTGSHVLHKSLDRLHAASMPDAAPAVNRLPPVLIPRERLHRGFDIIYTLSTVHQRFTFVRLFDPYLIGSRPTFSHLAHHHVSLTQQQWVVWCLRLYADTEGPALISHAARHLRGFLPSSRLRGTPSSAYRANGHAGNDLCIQISNA